MVSNHIFRVAVGLAMLFVGASEVLAAADDVVFCTRLRDGRPYGRIRVRSMECRWYEYELPHFDYLRDDILNVEDIVSANVSEVEDLKRTVEIEIPHLLLQSEFLWDNVDDLTLMVRNVPSPVTVKECDWVPNLDRTTKGVTVKAYCPGGTHVVGGGGDCADKEFGIVSPQTFVSRPHEDNGQAQMVASKPFADPVMFCPSCGVLLEYQNQSPCPNCQHDIRPKLKGWEVTCDPRMSYNYVWRLIANFDTIRGQWDPDEVDDAYEDLEDALPSGPVCTWAMCEANTVEWP